MTLFFVALAAFALGLLQFFFNIILFPDVFAGKILKAGGVFCVKVGLYALGLWLLFKLFRAFLAAGVTGFGVGFFIFLIIYAVSRLKKK